VAGVDTSITGPIARVAPEHLITSSPDLWARINGVRSEYRRAPWFYNATRFEPGKDNVFTECDNKRHDLRRKKMASGVSVLLLISLPRAKQSQYAGKENPELEISIDSHVKELVELIAKYAAPTESKLPSTPVNMAQKIPYFTLDVISHVGLGTAFGNLKNDTDVNDYLKSSEEGLRIANTAWALGLAKLRELPIIGPALSPSEKDVSGFGKMIAEARKVVNDRITRSTDQKSDMIASFIRNGITGDDLFQEVFEQILAGSDTTAASIRTIFLYIISHPRVYNKLRKEIDRTVKSGITSISSDIISDTQARQLPYLNAVVREAMRVHPPVVNIFSRITPDQGDLVTVDGKEYFIPGGTMIGYSAWSMHRNNKALYGEDAEVFRPERWLLDESIPEQKERLLQMTKTNDMIFGYGRWQCLGRTVALIEIHKCLFELLRHFDFALTNPYEPWHIFNSMGLLEIQDMWMNVTQREQVNA
jgi:cytochrome P450